MSTSSKRRKSNDTTRILENVEMLIALFEEQSQTEAGELSKSDLEDVVSSVESKLVDRFDELDRRIEKITAAVEAQQTIIEKKITSQLLIPAQVNEEESSTDHQPDPRPSINDEAESRWHQQKAAMLSKYGIDPDYRPLMEKTDAEPLGDALENVEVSSGKLEELHESIDNISAADAEQIEKLKEDLASQLRDAEVELSINRAKLSQMKAELETRQVELDRREEALEQKHNGSRGKRGFLDRLGRLTNRK